MALVSRSLDMHGSDVSGQVARGCEGFRTVCALEGTHAEMSHHMISVEQKKDVVKLGFK